MWDGTRRATIMGMTADSWVALGAAVIALGSLFFAGRAANAAKAQTQVARDQTDLQRQIRVDAAQPYVWIDLRPDDEHGKFLLLIVGNSGPTVATQIRVTFDPRLELPSEGTSHGAEARELLARGISSLPPGRQMKWKLGIASQLIADGYALAYTATVLGDGPFGPLEPLTYTIHLDDIRSTLAVPDGTLNGVALAVKSLTKAVENVSAALETASSLATSVMDSGDADQ